MDTFFILHYPIDVYPYGYTKTDKCDIVDDNKNYKMNQHTQGA